MPRTITAIVNDVIRQAGHLKKLDAEWVFPIECHDGWHRSVSVTVSLSDSEEHKDEVWVSVFACGWPKSKGRRQKNRSASRHFYGWATPNRLTRKWVGDVLRREIEAAHFAAQAFTEADLRESGYFVTEDDDVAIEKFETERKYFESTFKT